MVIEKIPPLTDYVEDTEEMAKILHSGIVRLLELVDSCEEKLMPSEGEKVNCVDFTISNCLM